MLEPMIRFAAGLVAGILLTVSTYLAFRLVAGRMIAGRP